MQAKCPFCAGDSNTKCPKCHGDGKVEIHFADGYLWTRACLDPACDFENGGRIMDGDGEPKEPSGKCVMCGGPTKWLLLGNMAEILPKDIDAPEIPN